MGINGQLKEKKNKLAPQIKALRSVRQNFQQVEVKYLEKKSAYDQAKSSIDAELSKIAGEVKQLETEVLESEQQYHELNMQLSAADTKLQRAHREQRCLSGKEQGNRYSKEFATLGEAYVAKIEELERQRKDARQEKEALMESYEDQLKQKKAFMQLEKLMSLKLKVAKQEMQNLADGRYGGIPNGAVMEERTAGVERLVIDG